MNTSLIRGSNAASVRAPASATYSIRAHGRAHSLQSTLVRPASASTAAAPRSQGCAQLSVASSAERTRVTPSADGRTASTADVGVYHCVVNQEVLARWSDGLFYLGRVLEVDRVGGRCLVTYEDKSSYWALFKDLQNVPTNPQTIDEMLCNVCHGGNSLPPNEIVICDNCGIGYHQQCHKPVVGVKLLKSRATWNCRLCVFVSTTKVNGTDTSTGTDTDNKGSTSTRSRSCAVGASHESVARFSRRRRTSTISSATSSARPLASPMPNLLGPLRDVDDVLTSLTGMTTRQRKGGAIKRGPHARVFGKMKLTLPYDPSKLEWDAQHQTNKQECYCYCGGPGDWCMKMVQCTRCDQWYHEACVQCLLYPLVYGDRMYVFVCGVCNLGTEYIKRITLSWTELIHLALFNLCLLYNGKVRNGAVVNGTGTSTGGTVPPNAMFDAPAISEWIHQHLTQLQLDEAYHRLSANSWRWTISRKAVRHTRWFTSSQQRAPYKFGLKQLAPPPRLPILLPPGTANDSLVQAAVQQARSVMEKMGSQHFGFEEDTHDDNNNEEFKLNKIKPRQRSRRSGIPAVAEVTQTGGRQHNGVVTSSRRDVIVNASSVVSSQDYKGQTDDNNNYCVAATPPGDQVPKLGVLEHFIPRPKAYNGVHHPFKTCLERSEELVVEKRKAKMLNYFGAKQEANLLQSRDLVIDDNQRRKHLHVVDVLRRKKGRKSDKERKLLEIAETVLGMTKSRKRKRNERKSIVNSTEASSNRTLTKSVQDAQMYEAVRSCFGGKERLVRGEGFDVAARRVTPDGTVQYLIEWRGIQER